VSPPGAPKASPSRLFPSLFFIHTHTHTHIYRCTYIYKRTTSIFSGALKFDETKRGDFLVGYTVCSSATYLVKGRKIVNGRQENGERA